MSSLQNVKGGAAKLNTGYYIPLFGLGTYELTGNEVKSSVDIALKCGYRLFDTAKYYKNEPELGAALEFCNDTKKGLQFSYIDMVLIHYPKAIKCEEKDPKNKEHRKLTYVELEKLKGSDASKRFKQ
ncbi:hypothetical protein ANCDUO_06303 [Ancylostoma duodenale]|uniref:NADP-dependent oxidoreductase domain-containing protein n=1 Tax=Ancylostoma duodenale TaxID=51022 RepID=A0A0C2GPY4_9BILA|nr:hypothetical protein ANCDUO_06303 [Ancylostoma duodenale]